MLVCVRVCCGCSYRAPEVSDGSYSFEVDYYSVGVILHIMLSGYAPEEGEELAFDGEEWEGVPTAAQGVCGCQWPDGQQECVCDAFRASFCLPRISAVCVLPHVADVVRGLMALDPTKRMSGIQVLFSDWLKDAPPTPSAPSPVRAPPGPKLARQSSSTMGVEEFTKLPLVTGGK